MSANYSFRNVTKVTTHVLQEMKAKGEKIAMLTAYDYSFARILESTGIDIILVGDSVGVVVAGHGTTLPVTMDEMIYHTRSVVRAGPLALVVADLPFLSYQVSLDEARLNAGRLVKEGGAEAVKLEGGVNCAATIPGTSKTTRKTRSSQNLPGGVLKKTRSIAPRAMGERTMGR